MYQKFYQKCVITLIGLLILLSTGTFAQSVYTLSGTIQSDKGETLPGVSILVQGQSRGTVSDIDGNYTIEVNGIETLIFSAIGFVTQRVSVNNQNNLSVTLQEDTQLLSEVVVIGYGEQKRSDFTGSVASVPSVLKEQPVTSPDRLLQGSVSGVQVTQASGQPGSGTTVRIRGGTSITAGNEPLYVIDGFPIYNSTATVDAGVSDGSKINPLSSINPTDIESIDVLKDASATAIYGSRGANGVILITTKRAKPNESRVSYDAFYGTQSVIKKLPLLNAEQWGSLKNDARVDAGKTPMYSPQELSQLGEGTDWQEEAFTSASIQNHNLSVYTGGEKSRMIVSGNYFRQDGVLINTGFERFSGRLNIDHYVNSKFKVGAFLTGSSVQSDLAPINAVRGILEMPPTVPLYDEAGEYTIVSNFETAIGNPINTLKKQTNESKTLRFLVNGFAEYEIIEGLTAKVLLGADLINNKQNRYMPSTVLEGIPGGVATVGSLSGTNWLNENTLTYKKAIGDNHFFDIIIGNTQQQAVEESVIASSSNFVSDDFEFNDLGSGTILEFNRSLYNKWVLQSYLARVNYGFGERLFLTLTVRADGSSRFGRDNKWGTFPSAAVAWNISNENFVQQLNVISFLKLRLSAGLTGNQEIAPYQSLPRLFYYRYNFDENLVGGFAPSSYGNSRLSWETTTQYNFGLDLGLFSNRVNLISDIYYKRTNDLLLEVPIPLTSGLESAFQNYGSIENKGIEIGLNTENVTGIFQWNTSLVFSANRNKVLSLGPGVNEFVPINPALPERATEIVRVGEPLGNFYMYRYDGVFQEGDDFSVSPSQNTRAGSQKYQDINGDGLITQAGDYTIVGNSQPLFLAGITNTFRYKNFDLSVFLQSSYGNKIFNFNRALLEIGSGFTGASATLLDRWTPTNTDTNIPRAIEDPSPTLSDRFVEDGSYLRLKNLTFGYSLPESIASTLKFQNARVYIALQDWITWTNYTGFDPEVSRNGQSAIGSGFDYGSYPASRTIIGGLSISF